jgi:tRNA uridine 5-carboxymethylaminomethyl modification enzyme
MASDAVGESHLACDGSFLIVNDRTVRTDVDYAGVPGFSTRLAQSSKLRVPTQWGRRGRLDGLTPAALGILAACLRCEARRKNSVAVATA